MKAFVISLATLLALFALTIFNGICINKTIDSLLNSASSITHSNNSIAVFSKEWDKAEPLIRLSSSSKETHKIDEAIKVLKIKSISKNASGFYEEKELLMEYLQQIKDDEKVSLDSII